MSVSHGSASSKLLHTTSWHKRSPRAGSAPAHSLTSLGLAAALALRLFLALPAGGVAAAAASSSKTGCPSLTSRARTSRDPVAPQAQCTSRLWLSPRIWEGWGRGGRMGERQAPAACS